MIPKSEIDDVLSNYDKNNISIATICSHSSLQLFHGAKKEGFKTIGLTTPKEKLIADTFPEATPHKYIMVKDWDELLNEEHQKTLIKENAIVIPHGSFVAYLKNEKLQNDYHVPLFGNRQTLEWEGNRNKQREWLEKAGLKLPKEYKTQAEARKKVFVKFPGAKGGSDYFTAESDKEVEKGLAKLVKLGNISKEDAENKTIQEFISGARYYHHYFYSLMEEVGDGNSQRVYGLEEGKLEITGMDKRIEPIDESYRGLPKIPKEFFDYTVTGNQPIIIREKFLFDVIKMGIDTVRNSKKLFPPGMIGPFCLETIYHPKTNFTTFEISARIVAGTNLYIKSGPYSDLTHNEPMSAGRRIAREIKMGIEKNRLEDIVY